MPNTKNVKNLENIAPQVKDMAPVDVFICTLIACALSNEKIGQVLHLSPRTIANRINLYINPVFAEINNPETHNRSQIVHTIHQIFNSSAIDKTKLITLYQEKNNYAEVINNLPLSSNYSQNTENNSFNSFYSNILI